MTGRLFAQEFVSKAYFAECMTICGVKLLSLTIDGLTR